MRRGTQATRVGGNFVIEQPSIGNRLDLLQVGERMSFEYFGAISALEPLDKDVLITLARLDLTDRDAFGSSPFGKGVGNHLRTVIQTSSLGRPKQSIKRLRARITRAEGMHMPTSMVKHSRFASSITFSIQNRRPQ